MDTFHHQKHHNIRSSVRYCCEALASIGLTFLSCFVTVLGSLVNKEERRRIWSAKNTFYIILGVIIGATAVYCFCSWWYLLSSLQRFLVFLPLLAAMVLLNFHNNKETGG